MVLTRLMESYNLHLLITVEEILHHLMLLLSRLLRNIDPMESVSFNRVR